jgi:hypothetical protein
MILLAKAMTLLPSKETFWDSMVRTSKYLLREYNLSHSRWGHSNVIQIHANKVCIYLLMWGVTRLTS